MQPVGRHTFFDLRGDIEVIRAARAQKGGSTRGPHTDGLLFFIATRPSKGSPVQCLLSKHQKYETTEASQTSCQTCVRMYQVTRLKRAAKVLGEVTAIEGAIRRIPKGATSSKNRPHDVYSVRCRVPGHYAPCSERVHVCELKRTGNLNNWWFVGQAPKKTFCCVKSLRSSYTGLYYKVAPVILQQVVLKSHPGDPTRGCIPRLLARPASISPPQNEDTGIPLVSVNFWSETRAVDPTQKVQGLVALSQSNWAHHRPPPPPFHSSF